MPDVISDEEIEELRRVLNPLINVHFKILQIPKAILAGFEPSQVGTITGVLMDACIPHLATILPDDKNLLELGLRRHGGEMGEREGYPDYDHISGKRVELKLLYVDPRDVKMKKPPTPREPSARLTQKVTIKNVDPDKDVLLVLAYQLRPNPDNLELFSPTVIDLGIFPVIRCIEARDRRLLKSGKWFGDYDTPAVLSKEGRRKKKQGLPLDETTYGRKESEGKDYNEDTNFGKLARIPYKPLKDFLGRYGYRDMSSVPEFGGEEKEETKLADLASSKQ